MEESGVELKQILDEERLADTPLLIMANKSDLMNAMEPSEVSDCVSDSSIMKCSVWLIFCWLLLAV